MQDNLLAARLLHRQPENPATPSAYPSVPRAHWMGAVSRLSAEYMVPLPGTIV